MNEKTGLTDESPMFLDPPRQRHLLSDLRTGGRRQLDLGQIGFHAENATSSGCRTNVDEEELVFDEFRDFRLFLVFSFDTEKTPEEEQTDFEF